MLAARSRPHLSSALSALTRTFYEITESIAIGNTKRVLREWNPTVYVSSTIAPVSSSSTSLALQAVTLLRRNSERFAEILVAEMAPPKKGNIVQISTREGSTSRSKPRNSGPRSGQAVVPNRPRPQEDVENVLPRVPPMSPERAPEERVTTLLRRFTEFHKESNKYAKPGNTLWKMKAEFKNFFPPGRDVGIRGHLHGVDVGQRFHFRAELAFSGLHRPPQAGIDWKIISRPHPPTAVLKPGLEYLPVGLSVVVSGRYEDNDDNGETLIYTGEGGQKSGTTKQAKNQKLKRGNKALVNNIDLKVPVRVIRADGKRPAADYSYDGLYMVVSYEFVLGKSNFKVYKFKLVREPGQKALSRPPVCFRTGGPSSTGFVELDNVLDQGEGFLSRSFSQQF